MFTEEQLEDMTMSLLDKLNYECKNGYEIERDYHSVFYDDTFEFCSLCDVRTFLRKLYSWDNG